MTGYQQPDSPKKSPGLKKVGKKKSKFVYTKRDVRDINVIKDELTLADIERDLAKLDDEDATDSKCSKPQNTEERQRRSGVVYFSSIPPGYNVDTMKKTLSSFAEIGRIYLQRNKNKKYYDRVHKYTEGWVEFVSKRKAKKVAAMLSGTRVLGKRRSLAYDTVWACQYLHGFKWVHLMEQLVYEQKVEEQRLRAEFSKVRKQAEFFTDKVEKGRHIRKLEEHVLKKGGQWEKYQRQVAQRQVIKDNDDDKKPTAIAEESSLMRMIFDAKSE